MLTKTLRTEWKWILLAFAIAATLASTIYQSYESGSGRTVFEFSLFFEILVFFVFSTFVVFGIKGFFERYSQKFANVIIFSSGVILTIVIFILSYQILFPA